MNSQDIIGHWMTLLPTEDGPSQELWMSYYFYPDQTLIMQNPRRREFVVRGKWKWENGQFFMGEMHWLHSTAPSHEPYEAIPCLEITEVAMVWKNPEGGDEVRFRRGGPLPDRKANLYWCEPREKK